MNKYTMRNKALGAVVGSAVGDALGAPFEFGPAGGYSRRFPTAVIGGIGEMVGGGPWKPGEFTDDTQMAIAQAESLLEHGRVNGADLFERFRIWASSAADVGIQTARGPRLWSSLGHRSLGPLPPQSDPSRRERVVDALRRISGLLREWDRGGLDGSGARTVGGDAR